MTVKNILVSYNDLPSSRAALRVALGLAHKYDAHVTGAVSHGPSRMATALGPWMTPELLTTVKETEATRRREIAKAFHDGCAAADKERPGKHHFIDLGGDADESLMEAARYYDMVVMGQYESDVESAHLAPHPDTVALHSGRPVLIVPRDWSEIRLGDRAVLAWDGGRAAARAMSQAMALLEDRSQVTILTVGQGRAARRREGLDVVAHLARHGVMTDWKNVPRNGGGVTGVILDMIEEKSAGLLVMGAYEHSRLAEELIGGTTKEVLKRCPVPVLMAH